MLKSQRTNRKPVLPTTVENIGNAFNGLETLHELALKTMLLKIDLMEYRSAGWELTGPVSAGTATLAHDNFIGFEVIGGLGNVYEGEPDLVHLIAAMTEYSVWLEYLEVTGYTAFSPVSGGNFTFVDPQGLVIAGSPVAHDLWINDNIEDQGSVVNLITTPSPSY